MKKTLLKISLLLSSLVVAQNQPPAITNFSATVNTTLKQVVVNYDVTDNENDLLDIYLRVSDNNKTTFIINTSSSTGDIGTGITPGTGKQIVWDYSALTGTSGNYVVQVVADDKQVPSIQQLVNMVDSVRLKADMQIVEGIRHYSAGAAHLQQVKDTITNRFTRFGLNPIVQTFTYTTYSAQNFNGKKQGLVYEDTVIILGGHYDCVNNSPGADDNGTAVLGLLEASEILSKYNFKRSIRFLGFDLEELGLLGSKAYTNNGIYGYEKIKGMIDLEMIGYFSNRNNSQTFPNGFNLLFPTAYGQVQADNFRGNFITNVANTISSSLENAFFNNAAAFVPALKVINIEVSGTGTSTQDLRRSDHAPFWDKGYKALMLTDGANFRNKNYHTVNDISDSLNFTFITNVIKATVATLASQAELMHSDAKNATINLPNVPANLSELNNALPQILISPNPADDFFSICWDGSSAPVAEIMVYDALGKKVYHSKVIDGAKNEHTVFTNLFSSGLYTVKCINTKGKSVEKKVIKK